MLKLHLSDLWKRLIYFLEVYCHFKNYFSILKLFLCDTQTLGVNCKTQLKLHVFFSTKGK